MNYISLDEAKRLCKPWSKSSEKNCEYCLGTGVLYKDSLDPESKEWMKGVEEKVCVCQLDN